MADEVIEAVVEQPVETPKTPAEVAEVNVPEVQPELPLAEPEVAEVKEEVKEPEKPEETQDWRDKQLRKQHAKIKDRERALAEATQRIADLEVLAKRPADGEAAPTQNYSRDEIQREATRIVQQQNYARELETTNSAGEKAYGKDWSASLENLATLGTVEMDVMQGILGTDAPAKVLYELGKNPAEYQRIMELEPHRRQTEFVKLSLQPAKAKPSNAPAPTEPVKARVSPSVEMSDKMTDEQWYAARAKDRQAKFAKRA